MARVSQSYDFAKEVSVPQILKVLQARGIRTSGAVWVHDALKEYLAHNISLGDICIAAEARACGKPVASFDRDFDGISGVVRYEPK